MKIKNLFTILGILTLAFFNTAFVNPNNVQTETPEIGDQSFIEFLSLFDKVEMPFEVGLDDFEKYKKQKVSKSKVKKNKDSKGRAREQLMRQYINSDLMMSRMGPPQIMPVARFYPDDQTIAVIYIPYRAFGGFDNINFQMSLFDLKGNNISSFEDGKMTLDGSFSLGFTSPYSNTQTFSIDANGHIQTQNYKILWKDDVQKKGIENNEIVGYQLESSALYQIKNKGLVATVKSASNEDRAGL